MRVGERDRDAETGTERERGRERQEETETQRETDREMETKKERYGVCSAVGQLARRQESELPEWGCISVRRKQDTVKSKGQWRSGGPSRASS